MSKDMRRREFITLLGGAAAAWPLAVRAQQRPTVPVVGYLSTRPSEAPGPPLEGFRQGLREAGFVEGQNVAIEYRYANGQSDKLPALAAELVKLRVSVILSMGSAASVAAKSVTSTIPIVAAGGGDPVRQGLVASINRPGGNVTAVSMLSPDLEAKRIGLLHELVPQAKSLAALIDPNTPEAELREQEVQTAARRLGLPIRILRVGREAEIELAFATLAQEQTGALTVTASTFYTPLSSRLIALAAQYGIPASYELREVTQAGGLMSYAPSVTEITRQAGVYVGRILKGEKPADLPVMLPSRFEFVINLKTAKALGLTVPPGVLAIADEVIE